MTHPIDLDRLRSAIRTLVELDEAEQPVISCYLNLTEQWNDVPGRRAARIRQALPIDARPAFDAALEPIRRYLASALQPDARSVVAFSRSGARPFFLAMQFQVPVDEQLTLDAAPSIYGLVQLKDDYHRYIVLLTTAGYARILEVSLGAVTTDLWAARPELQERLAGAWTREVYQRHRHERTERFVQEKLRLLERAVALGGHSHVMVIGDDELAARFRASLSPQLSAKLIEGVDVSDPGNTSGVIRASMLRFIQCEEKEGLDTSTRLVRELRKGGLAVAGTEASLRALELGQVDQLVLSATYVPPAGMRCRSCGTVHPDLGAPAVCPRCGDSELSSADVRDELVRLAERHGVEVEVVQDDIEIRHVGGVGCLLRYHSAWHPPPFQNEA